jgi:hypothetical protein
VTPKEPDWLTKARREMAVAHERFDAIPTPTENTIVACAAALRAEGFTKNVSISGKPMSLEAVAAAGLWPLGDWVSLLKDWRYLCAEATEENA